MPRDVFDLEGMREARIAYVLADGSRRAALLQTESARWEAVEIADVIVVQMREDDVLDRIGIDAQQAQRFDRTSAGRVRLRRAATSALKPVSMTKLRPHPWPARRNSPSASDYRADPAPMK